MEQDRFKKVLAQNLKSIRKSKSLTTSDVAKILGVSQAKISYIEHCKGVLSSADIAVLSRRLDIPVIEFFRGLETEDGSEIQGIIPHLVRYGAVLLAKPPGITLKSIPFEEIFGRSLGFIEDDRLHKGLCAALIVQAAKTEINLDRIFALIGGNDFLTNKAVEQARICLAILDRLEKRKKLHISRAKKQIRELLDLASKLLKIEIETGSALSREELLDLSEFVEDCLNAKG
jgi:transcriptional regulator with XRE-family HTH domain